MFKIESYVTPILLSYVDKYVRDFKPADAQVSLWGGGVALHNLVLKADVLQQEVALPFTLVSGRIHELLIQVPWTKIMSEPIVVTIDTIECVLSLTRPAEMSEESIPESPSRKPQVVEAPPGYMQALVRRIVSNIALRVHHLIVKYVQDDIVLSLNVKHLAVDSAGVNWEPTFADIDQAQPVIRRLMRLDDLTLCLDRADADGKIRFYQEPLLYRCQLDLRILTRLVSANTRRASSLSIQLRSTKLAWGVTGDQLTMLIRLVRERAVVVASSPVPPAKTTDAQAAPLHAQSSNTAEPAHSESWTEWAWSWLPALVDREGGVQAPAPPTPVPLHFAAYFDDVSVVFKVMEIDSNNRKRSRGVLEFSATQTAFKSYVCNPTTIRMRAGTRSLSLTSRGKCICGHVDYNTLMEEPTFYLRKKEIQGPEEEWTWPDDDLSQVVETAQAVDEQYRSSPELTQQASVTPVKLASGSGWPDVGQPEEPASTQEIKEPKDSGVEFWTQMAPQFFVEYIHERSPPEVVANPYENPPTDFQYSDWVEECDVKMQLALMEVRVCMGLIHRLSVLSTVFKELPPVPIPELPMRVLTIEECEALSDNLPQRRVNIEVLGLHIVVHPWDHALLERPTLPPVVLDLDLPKINVAINAPLYPHRVCVAACQMPEDSGPLWQGARLHVTVKISSIQAKICSFNDVKARPCFRTDVKAVFHILLNKEYFLSRESVLLAYSVKIREANLCGSAARLQAAWRVPKSLWMKQISAALKFTTLAKDALNDEEAVAIDVTFEDFLVRGFVNRNTTTHIVTLQAAKATALHEPQGSDLSQAWLFSAPDCHTNMPYLRVAVQWCKTALPHSLEYAGFYTEPAAVAVDPLFIAWLAYRPALKPLDTLSASASMKSLSSQYFVRRRTTGTSSSGRGGTRSSGAEVHMRRSVGSSDKEQGREDLRTVIKPKSALEQYMSGAKLLALHERLRRMLVNVEIGLTSVYVTMKTASAVDCATVRDAMERHASLAEDVLALSMGRSTLFSNTLTKQFWNDIRHDGPTFVALKAQKPQVQDSFPWKLKLADVSIYTLDAVVPSETTGRERSLRSQLRIASLARPRTVLELVTSTLTLSVVTKQVQIKQLPKKEPVKKDKEQTPEEQRLKYFTSGMSFKPTTLKEFVRGPAKRKKDKSTEQPEKKEPEPVPITTTGPVVSLGIHLHGDTPPLIFRLEQDQVHMVAAALHCFTHIKVLLMRPPLYIPRASSSPMMGGPRSVIRSASEMDHLQTPSDDSTSEKSELIPIFEAQSARDITMDIKTFFWFQWVVSRVTIVATTWQSKLALDIDDIITSLDLQAHYNQLKIKVASASVRHYARTADDEWTAGVLGGRVLEAREPSNAKEDNHFMAITITQAQISNLPASWKEELHPKLLERKRSSDSMWEIYATLAPLEVVIQPTILNQIISLVLEMAPRSFCPLAKEKEAGRSDVHWPFCYVTAGGLRMLLTVQDEEIYKDEDDTFVFVIGKVTVSPHPDNPICRRPINPAMDAGWLNTTGALDGHQYELTIKNVGIRCAQFHQLVSQENSEAEMTNGTARENPARKWTEKIVTPSITPILHSVDISCVLAPALYMNGMLTCGPAVELNLLSDCAIEVSTDQIVMAQKVMYMLSKAFKERKSQSLLLCDEEHQHVCPYATLLMSPSDSDDNYNYDHSTSFAADDLKTSNEFYRGADSGVDCAAGSVTQGTGLDSMPSLLKKSVSVAFVEQWSDPSEYLELFVTMGTIELSLYTVDDGSPEVTPLRPPTKWKSTAAAEPFVQVVMKEEERQSVDEEGSNALTRETPASAASHSARSLTEIHRNADIGKTKLDFPYNFQHARCNEGNIPLLHISLHQPNLYYWRKTSQKSFQVSLFDAWIGLGGGRTDNYWHAPLLNTEKGFADPVTDIPPALATMKIVAPSAAVPGNAAVRGTIRLDIERPVMLEVSSDRLQRLKKINILMKDRMLPSLARGSFIDRSESVMEELPLLYRIKTLLVQQSIESVTVQTTQLGVSGSLGAVGWDSLSVQVAAGGRPERLVVRSLLTALLVTTGTPGDSRHVVVHPVMMGAELEASWEAWRRAEGGLSVREPTVRVCLDVDCIDLDLRPAELVVLNRIQDVLRHILADDEDCAEGDDVDKIPSSSSELQSEPTQSRVGFDRRISYSSTDASNEEHFYKDDLRSGAFKIVSGGQLPMAYQVTLYHNAVSWRYPHPRAISRLVIFPLPGQEEETPCVLELYIPLLGRWEAHTRFSVPLGEPREIQLHVPAPESVSAQIWRYRVLEYEEQPLPFQFDINRFTPRTDPMKYQCCPNEPVGKTGCGVTAEQLSGVVRVDSCFSPRLSPRVRLVTRIASLALYLHNSLPYLTSQCTALEGYYVSKPLWRAHRVLCVRVRSGTLHARLGSPAGALLLLDASLSSDIVECSSGTMEQLVEEFRIRGGLSLPTNALSRARVAMSQLNVALHVPRLRTLQALATDWDTALQTHAYNVSEDGVDTEPYLSSVEQHEVTETDLEGRLSLWVHNSCAAALRVGQEGTEEVVPLGPGARLAYRWRSPTAPKKLRFALVGPSTDWRWSTSIPFTIDHYRIKLHDAEALKNSKSVRVEDVYLYSSVEERGSRLCIRLAGRLSLANMLRFNLLYKARARCNESNQWRTVSSGELSAESVGRTVLCAADCEMTVKIKFTGDTGWSGDIPLKECPKENVPWLVKVPCEGDIPYMSVWTRVIRARSDGRIFATVWPLYVLYSHLPLDTDVLIMTESSSEAEEPPPLVQAAPGRGASTHLLAPGTTAARHTLSFQYRNIDCPVTKEAVPLHYGMTDTSVFDKRTSVSTIEEVFADTMQWLERSERSAISDWPYSIVTKHYPGKWKPALLQPRCDVTVQYRAVRAGGGCSLEVQLRPMVLLCNSAPISLTLRAHDAAPLCKLEPGTAISPPSAVLTKPFFISVEMGRETFVSGELSVTSTELGRYGTPAPGRIALDRPTEMAIQCNHKVAILTMYYEIKEEINILGLTSTYMLINRLDTDIMISALAVPNEDDEQVVLRPTMYKTVRPTPHSSAYGCSLCKFWVATRMWRGSDPAELRLYLCVTLPNASSTLRAAPVRLGHPPVRRSIALTDETMTSVPVVVTQVKHEGRWVVTVAPDPCPQLLVHNYTRGSIGIAQPAKTADEPSTSKTMIRTECPGTTWHCVIHPGGVKHYSTPSYCMRYPPPASGASPPAMSFLTFARMLDVSSKPEWCAPVAAADGEQLLQLADGETVKMRLRTHPHSAHLELRDVDQHDISASDIRRRLIGAFTSEDIMESTKTTRSSIAPPLKRTDADDKLLAQSIDHGSNLSWQSYPVAPTITGIFQGPPESQASYMTQEVQLESRIDSDTQKGDPSTLLLFATNRDSIDVDQLSRAAMRTNSMDSAEVTSVFHGVYDNEWDETASWRACDRLRLLATSVAVQFASRADSRPLVALHLDRAGVFVKSDSRRTKTTISIADVQVDNLQYESGQYDFAVVASTRGVPLPDEQWPPLWHVFGERRAFATRHRDARALLRLTHDAWISAGRSYSEITEVEVRAGPLALYVEDAYVTALASLCRAATYGARAGPACSALLAEERALRAPLRLRTLHVHPLDVTLTLHTAVRMYIALDQSPLRLSAFKLNDVMTSTERLTHALTVHYLSAAILGAGWVVGGLELLGAPGALAARVGGATGGVRGVASAAAAALLRSLSAWASSLARNLDLLAGDEEHARRAAAARRRPPQSFMAGLATGITNFAINILGAVGGLAHHPVVGVAVGETESGATALRRGLIGAFAKPLSATADLVAYAGQGLLTQTGWDPVPQPRRSWNSAERDSGWRRDCVRWVFRLAELSALAGYQVLLDGAPVQLLFTHKFLVVAQPDSERIVEMIDFRFCSIGPYQGQIIELLVTQRRPSKMFETRIISEEDEVQISAAAMARVARYTGAETCPVSSTLGVTPDTRVLALLPAPGRSLALHAALLTSTHHNSDAHFPLL